MFLLQPKKQTMQLFTNKVVFTLIVGFSFISQTFAQKTDANIFGDVQSNGEHIPFVNVFLEGTSLGTSTDVTGHYMMIDLPVGTHTLVAKALGYKSQKQQVKVESGKTLEVNFTLEEEVMSLNDVVVTGTKTFKRSTESAVIVGVLDNKILNLVQACNISEGLRFQPGLRVETDCQTCNYTQLRMNGLQGGYSQILINGRPIFSPITGLYGMEQMPANMVDRIEVVRGGGSALYGSGAIGGTVNIITRTPKESSYEFSSTSSFIDGTTKDNVLNGNISMLTHKRNAGATLFVNRRNRDMYDANGDHFSELPELSNNSFGANVFFKPTYNQKIELNFSSLSEYRYGGEMIDKPAYLTQQSEERTHNVLMAGADYQINFNEDKTSFIAYLAGQNTTRDHYTGIFPDSIDDIQAHYLQAPYGNTDNTTIQGGTQINHAFQDFLGGRNVITAGVEYVYDDVFDTIPAYNYEIDQTTTNFGIFAQSDWDISRNFNVLLGVRGDKHNLVDNMIFSPRVSLLYKIKQYTQARFTWGTGFRAPQAFDADMHIAFAGGGISRVELAPDLHEERSNSISGSINFDKPTEKYIIGFTLEGFYTNLMDAFYLQPLEEDEFGDVYEKRNGPGAIVQGGTFEARANYMRKIQLEAGYTLQSSLYKEAVVVIEGLESKREFLRSPNQYGYATLTFTPNKHINASFSSVYTGTMLMAHLAGAPEQSEDEFVNSPEFWELNVKLGYTFYLKKVDTALELYSGIKNITNAYQNDFDGGKNRDSNYVYGPGQPITYFFGLKIRSL